MCVVFARNRFPACLVQCVYCCAFMWCVRLTCVCVFLLCLYMCGSFVFRCPVLIHSPVCVCVGVCVVTSLDPSVGVLAVECVHVTACMFHSFYLCVFRRTCR